MAVTVGFEPTVGSTPTQLFESCTFGRSDTSPRESLAQARGRVEPEGGRRRASTRRGYDAEMSWSLRTPFTNARRRAWTRRAQRPGELLYVAIGDSAAQGVGARRLDASYVGRLAARLERLSGRTVRVVNLSRYGARLVDALERQLPLLAELDPDVVTIAIGSNDMVRFDSTQFSEEFTRLVAALPPHAIVADLPCFHFGEREKDAVIASRIIHDAVLDRGLGFAPLHRVTEMRRGWGSWPEFTWDQFHPSALGYRVWESAFAGALAQRARALR